MIIFSPNTKFTMQRIADHVANGAYFYTAISWQEHLSWEEEEVDYGYGYELEGRSVLHNPIAPFLKKLEKRYDLLLTPRQRNYRLEKGHPICTCIVQQSLFDKYAWTVHLLFTTPRTRDFNSQCGVEPTKIVNTLERQKIENLQTMFQNFSWTKPEIQNEIDLISTYFKDREELQFVLNNPVAIKATQQMTFELVRTDHKSYQPTEKQYKDRIKSFSWSWRYSKQSFSKMKAKLMTIVNNLVSQKRNELAARNRAALANYFKMIESWAVFKSSRQQSGELLHFAQRFVSRKAKKSWQQIQITPPHLVYLPRLEKYADNLKEYRKRRNYFHQFGVEIPLELSRADNMFDIVDYLNDYNKKFPNRLRKSEEQILEELMKDDEE